ncbi:MAG: HEAT repeat domain-containing protein [Planctomycetota bacterium]|jgi:HEAT repeat protein|nr:HEAT repeat domain-containing protein [Planctomycetota bacterium]
MNRLLKPALSSSVLFLVGLLAAAGCSQPRQEAVAPPPTDAAAADGASKTAAPASDTSAPDAAEPAVTPDETVAVAVVEDDGGITTLVETLTTSDDSRARVAALDTIASELRGGLPALEALVAALDDEAAVIRWHAARAIGMIGHEAASAIPVLVERLADDDAVVVTQAAAAIGQIRGDDDRSEIPEADIAIYEAAVQPLVRTAVHPDPRARRAAIRALRGLSASPQALAETVLDHLDEVDPQMVLPAMHTLADMKGEAVPFLLRALEDPKSRYWAEVVLSEIGEDAAPAVEPLSRLAAEGEVEERVQAILALAAIGEPAQAASAQLIAALESSDDSLRYVAAYAAGKVRAADADEALTAAAAADDPLLAALASWARARIHPDDEALLAQAVDRLTQGLASDSPPVRRAAVEGLSGLADRLVPGDRQALAAVFAGMIADPVPAVGLAAGGALIRLGGDAVEPLTEALSAPAIRNDAMEILTELGPAALPALDAMVQGLADADPVYRADAAMAIAAIGPEATAAVPALEKLLGDESAEASVRYTAAYALGRIGPAAKAAEPMLRKLAESDDELMATVAVWAALKVVPDDRTLFDTAIPKLTDALDDERELVRLEAVVSLGEIGSRADSARPLLEMMAEEDPSRTVRRAAAAAVKKIQGD